MVSLTVKTNSNKVEIWEGEKLVFSRKGRIKKERLPIVKRVYGIVWREYGLYGWQSVGYVVHKSLVGKDKGKWVLNYKGGKVMAGKLLDCFRKVRDDQGRV